MSVSFNTPIGTLNYTFITGEGRDNLSGVAQYSTQLVLTEEEAKPLLDVINSVWAESGIKKQPKSFGYKTLEDGTLAFNFKTNVDGKFGRTKVKVYDSKGKEADFSNIMIGNGTQGRIGGTAAIYDQPAQSGVTLYLNKIQIIKLEVYEGSGEDFGAVEGGYEFQDEFTASNNDHTDPKPSLKRF